MHPTRDTSLGRVRSRTNSTRDTHPVGCACAPISVVRRFDLVWYALQRGAADYWRDFEIPKIVYPDIYEPQSFAWDANAMYLANTRYFIPTNEKWLCGLLNSIAVEWFYRIVS